ncbi:hypothetical protein DSECCO2_635060 [anaerobic digester metagenome]
MKVINETLEVEGALMTPLTLEPSMNTCVESSMIRLTFCIRMELFTNSWPLSKRYIFRPKSAFRTTFSSIRTPLSLTTIWVMVSFLSIVTAVPWIFR